MRLKALLGQRKVSKKTRINRFFCITGNSTIYPKTAIKELKGSVPFFRIYLTHARPQKRVLTPLILFNSLITRRKYLSGYSLRKLNRKGYRCYAKQLNCSAKSGCGLRRDTRLLIPYTARGMPTRPAHTTPAPWRSRWKSRNE